jgi:hypothetical protein
VLREPRTHDNLIGVLAEMQSVADPDDRLLSPQIEDAHEEI